MFLGNLGVMELLIIFVAVIIPVVFCATQAKKLNHSAIIWGILGLFLSYVAMLVVYLLVKQKEGKLF